MGVPLTHDVMSPTGVLLLSPLKMSRPVSQHAAEKTPKVTRVLPMVVELTAVQGCAMAPRTDAGAAASPYARLPAHKSLGTGTHYDARAAAAAAADKAAEVALVRLSTVVSPAVLPPASVRLVTVSEHVMS